MYKVLKRTIDGLSSPFQGYQYEPGREYVCDDFDPNPDEDCSRGYYATEIDGLIYSFRNLSSYEVWEYEVWEVEVGGRKVEADQFKRRYERIKLLRQVPYEEIKELAQAEEEKVGYKLSEALFPINPFTIEAGPVTEEEISLLKQWASVWASVRDSVRASVRDSVGNLIRTSVRASVWDLVGDLVGDSVGDMVVDSVEASVRTSVRDLIGDSAWASVRDSVRASVGAYISSLFPGIRKWKYIDHIGGENPFQSCIDLWHRGFVPSFDGNVWRLHAGEQAEVVWEGHMGRVETPVREPMKTVYIAGPYTARTLEQETENVYNAAKAAFHYYCHGCAVYCPHLQTSYIGRTFNTGELKYQDWMANDLCWLKKCDIVVFLPGWQASAGASCEHKHAALQGKEIVYWENAQQEVEKK